MSIPFQVNLTPFEQSLYRVASLIAEKLKASKTVWIMGNGGSAATADHFEIDLLSIKISDFTTPIKVFSLNSNLSVITAISNDIGYDSIFSIQLMRKASKGDIAVFISASGNSSNLVKAAEVCLQKEIETVGILGFDGGILLGKMANTIHVETRLGDYCESENYHLAICHQLSQLTQDFLFKHP